METIQWSSDIHLDSCTDQVMYDYVYSINPDKDLIITGDISVSTRLENDLARFSRVMNTGKIYFVLGNHDYYRANINAVRYQIKFMLQNYENLIYLPDRGPIKLNDDWAIVGVDGWADAKAGNFHASPSLLRDYQAIHDFIGKSDLQKEKMLGRLGEEEAFRLRDILSRRIDQPNILLVTHVPPYEEAHLFEGEQATPLYTPHFVCKSVGEVIDEYANEHKDKHIKVICGHTHHACEIVKGNITVTVAKAEYKQPEINLIQL